MEEQKNAHECADASAFLEDNKIMDTSIENKNTLNKKISKKDIITKADNYRKNSDFVLAEKICAKFNGMDFLLKEQKLLAPFNKKYSGAINGKNAEFIVNPGKDNSHKGKIQGKIYDTNVNLIVSSDLFGRKIISGKYGYTHVELIISKDLFSIYIEGKNSKIILKKNFIYNNQSIEGKFEYPNELLPVVLSYIKCFEAAKKEDSTLIA